MSDAGAVIVRDPVKQGRDSQPSLMGSFALIALLGIALLWSFWSTLALMARDWDLDPNYSVCILVPLAALYMVWQERAELARLPWRPCWWGLGLVIAGTALRAFGLVQVMESAERYAFVLTIAGLVLLVAGWAVFRHLFWILAFLLLMVPLPGRIHNLISAPLQGFATQGAVFTLELFGDAVLREGNILVVEDQPLAVAEACSGLRMLTAFVVVGCVLAYVIYRPRWQKVVLVLSTVPVAIFCNLARLVATVELYKFAGEEAAQRFFHDFAGWTMMPLGIALLLAELWVLSLLLIEKPRAAGP